jgi:hypothetical protein
MPTRDELATTIRAVLESPNEADQNGEAANVVDGLFAIARALEHLAKVLESERYDRLTARRGVTP